MKGRAGPEPAAGQPHLVLDHTGRSKNRSMVAGVWREQIQVVPSHGQSFQQVPLAFAKIHPPGEHSPVTSGIKEMALDASRRQQRSSVGPWDSEWEAWDSGQALRKAA